MRITKFTHIYDPVGQIIGSYAEIDELRKRPEVVEIQDKIRSGLYTEEEVAALKRQLPCIAINAWFKDNKRKNELAHPTGLVAIDVDNDDPDIPAKILDNKEILGLVWLVPSVRHGWHVVCRRQPYMSIADYLLFFQRTTGVQPDMACKDLARAFYLGADEPLFVNAAAFDPNEPTPAWLTDASSSSTPTPAPAVTPTPAPAAATTTATPTPAAATTTTATTTPAPITTTTTALQTHYKGIALTDIAAVLLDLGGGAPVTGERNTRLFAAATELKNICDFAADAIYAALLPHSTLPPEELRQLCASACKYRQKPCISGTLQTVLDSFAVGEGEGAAIDFPLPPVLRHYYKAAPDDFKSNVLLVLLAFLGTLACRVKAVFRQKKQPLSFCICPIAEQASGKSYVRDVQSVVMASVIERDAAERAAAKAWRREHPKKKGRPKKDEEKEQEPTWCIRNIPENVSSTALLKMIDDAGGLGCIQVLDEINIAASAEKKNWSRINEILKAAYDGGEYSQEYMNQEISWSGSVQVNLSTVWSAQPGTLANYFCDDKWIDGAASRFIFARIPSQAFKPYTPWKTFTPKELEEINTTCRRLDAMSVTTDPFDSDRLIARAEQCISLPWLELEMAKWDEQHRLLAEGAKDKQRDTFRRRDTAIGYRAGVLCFLLWGSKDTPAVRQNTKKFARWVATRALEGHIRYVPSTAIQAQAHTTFLAEKAYNMLPAAFTREELINTLKMCNLASPEHVVINAWKKSGKITAYKKYQAANFQKTS